MIRQGEVYLVNFAKKYNSEFEKIRPAVVLQNNFLNKAIEQKKYKSILVVPLSTSSINDNFNLPIKARDNLLQDSECVANWICTLDIDRFLFDKGILTVLTDSELEALQGKVCNLM